MQAIIQPKPSLLRRRWKEVTVVVLGFLFVLPGTVVFADAMLDLNLPFRALTYVEEHFEDRTIFRYSPLHSAVMAAMTCGWFIMGIGLARIDAKFVGKAWFCIFMGSVMVFLVIRPQPESTVIVTEEKMYQVVPAKEKAVNFSQIDRVTSWRKGETAVWTLYAKEDFVEDLTLPELWVVVEDRLLEILRERGLQVNEVEDLGRYIVKD